MLIAIDNTMTKLSMGWFKEFRFYRLAKASVFYFYNHIITWTPSYHVRHAYLRHVLRIKIGKGSSIHMGCFITGNNIIIGRNCVINRKCYLDGRTGLVMGDNVGISPEAYILSQTHLIRDPEFSVVGGLVTLEDFVWVGARAMIMPGVTVCRGCVVGAGAVVTRSSLPYKILAGVPAKEIGNRPENLKYTLSFFPFFDTDIS